MNARIARRRWSEAEDAKLIALRDDRVPYKHIAKVVGHSQQACQTRYWHLTKPDEPMPEAPLPDDEPSSAEQSDVDAPTQAREGLDMRSLAKLLLDAAIALEAEADRRGEP